MFAVNKSSGACGLPQALPCSKLGDMNLANQIRWFLNYVKDRYGSFEAAYEFHLKNNWY